MSAAAAKQQANFLPNAFQTPNDIVDQLMPYLTGDEFKCLMFAVREILGWRDSFSTREKEIALSRFVIGTGLSKPKVNSALKGLTTYRILHRVGKPKGSQSQVWRLPESADVLWDSLMTRKQQRENLSVMKVKKAVKVSAAKRNSGTTVVPVNKISGTTVVLQSGTTVVPPTGTTVVPNQIPVANTNEIPIAAANDLQNREGQDQKAAAAATHEGNPELLDGKAQVFKLYEQEIGALTPLITDTINDWLNDAPDPSWVVNAINEAVLAGARNSRYIDRIINRCRLENWREKPGTTRQRNTTVKAKAPTSPSSAPPPSPQPPGEKQSFPVIDGEAVKRRMQESWARKQQQQEGHNG